MSNSTEKFFPVLAKNLSPTQPFYRQLQNRTWSKWVDRAGLPLLHNWGIYSHPATI
jgi:hypothetical protein